MKAHLDLLLLSVLSGIQFCLCLVLYFQSSLGRFRSSPMEICFYILETSQAPLIPSGEHVPFILLRKNSLRTEIPEKCPWA